MECKVIQDLMPLYIDGCCSDESKRLVQEHLKTCTACQKALEVMQDFPPVTAVKADVPVKKLSRITDWKASILQSALLFCSFILLTAGVTLEAYTPSGAFNGMWALALIVPSSGLLLSLANWYFVRLYTSKRAFSNCSMLATFGVILCGYIWACPHYGLGIAPMGGIPASFRILTGIGAVLSVIFCVLSKVLSGQYAKMLGKM